VGGVRAPVAALPVGRTVVIEAERESDFLFPLPLIVEPVL